MLPEGKKDDPEHIELFFGLAGPAGVEIKKVIPILKECLAKVNYHTEEISMSRLLGQIKNYESELVYKPEDDRIRTHMEVGTKFRQESGMAGALAVLATLDVMGHRERLAEQEKAQQKTAYVFRSLKHPAEVEALRQIYGRAFLLIALHSPRDSRIQNLQQQIAESYSDMHTQKYSDKARNLISRDEAELENEDFGQNVRDTFPKADVFINASDDGSLRTSLIRFIELLFGNTFHTPKPDEFGMFVAHASARRSSSLSRQVGAVITNDLGDVIGVGMNEVPKPFGGFFADGDNCDKRNLALGYEPNDKKKKQVFVDVLSKLKEYGGVIDDSVADFEGLYHDARKEIKSAHIMNLIEFTREVHAEMAAITSAARSTVSVGNCTLYTTTFPCHDCAKHIISSGIKQVVYIEPYPKSLALELYFDLIALDKESEEKVLFKPFVGIAPRCYLDLFEKNERKNPDGTKREWNSSIAEPRFYEHPGVYRRKERDEADHLLAVLEEKKIYLKADLARLGRKGPDSNASH